VLIPFGLKNKFLAGKDENKRRRTYRESGEQISAVMAKEKCF
jgi:hypothetical protein